MGKKETIEYYQRFDIVKRGFEMPPRVCILAPGIHANMEDAYDDITADFIIAVNYAGAIKLKDRAIDMWLVTDGKCRCVSWFNEINDVFNGVRCFSTWVCRRTMPIPCTYPKHRFYTLTLFKGKLNGAEYTPVPGYFRDDLSVVGTALNIAELCGAKYIELCGVDMYGDLYYDGAYRNLPDYRNRKLYSCDNLDSAIRYTKSKGVDVVSLSTTALKSVDCPTYSGRTASVPIAV